MASKARRLDLLNIGLKLKYTLGTGGWRSGGLKNKDGEANMTQSDLQFSNHITIRYLGKSRLHRNIEQG